MDKQREIHIIVAGNAGSGKSQVAYIIKEALKNAGIDVQFDCGFDYMDINDFDTQLKTNYDERCKAINEKSLVTLKELQIKAVFKSNGISNNLHDL